MKINKLTFLCPLLALSMPALSNDVHDGPFDVTQAQYNSGFSHQSFTNEYNGFSSSRLRAVVSNVPGSSQILAMLDGMSRYAEEMSDWEEYVEYGNDVEYYKVKNADLTDNRAYAVLLHTEITVIKDNKPYTYRHGDDISGSDWDNNGQIDVLEGFGTFDDGELRIR